jgi:hypothetical protein
VTPSRAPGLPVGEIRSRARDGVRSVFPPGDTYGNELFGAAGVEGASGYTDAIDAARLVPSVFMPQRLEKLIEVGREPMHGDVSLDTTIGGFRAAMPVYVSALAPPADAADDLGLALCRQAGRLGLPMVIGQTVLPSCHDRLAPGAERPVLARIRVYAEELPPGCGGVVVQQAAQDADTEMWQLVYRDPSVRPLLDTGRLALEFRVGQGAAPGLGSMAVVADATVGESAHRHLVAPAHRPDRAVWAGNPGTVTGEMLRELIRMMRDRFPLARAWIKLPPGRDVLEAALTAWHAGADAVTVDGGEAGTAWAPYRFLDHVGLSLGDCLRRIGRQSACLLVSGRMWEGTRAVKSIALGATAIGLGRAAVLAVEEDPAEGLVRLVQCLELEMRLLISALGKYSPRTLDVSDVLWPHCKGC